MTHQREISGKFGKGNPGKPKGAVSHTTRSVKAAIELAAEGLGGAARLQEWAASSPENERIFWSSIYPRLLPMQVTGEGGGALILQLTSTDAKL